VLSYKNSLTRRLKAFVFYILLQTIKPIFIDYLITRMDIIIGVISDIKELQRFGYI
jgi:hypothetical protein